jgi:glycosyltransferase involved in cell wall biosynthesis
MVFVGNGSFSGSGSGLGLSKSAVWKETLDELARRLEVRDRLVFTGHVPQRDLDSFYERSAFTILPSVREGFGLVVVEGWLHRKPTVVTERAGVTELIREGWNGLLFDPERPETLAEKMEQLLEDGGELGRKLGQNGYRTSEKCTLEVAAKAEAALVQEAVEA